MQKKKTEDRFKDIRELAIEEAKKHGHSEIDTDHLLMAILSPESPAYQLLSDLVDIDKFKSELEKTMNKASGEMPLQPSGLSIRADLAYINAGYNYVNNDHEPRLDADIHLLVGITEFEDGIAARLLQKYKVTTSKLLEGAEKYRSSIN